MYKIQFISIQMRLMIAFFCSIHCLFVLLCNGISVVYGPHWIGFASFICINQRTRYYRGTDIHNFPWKYIQIEECI